jgi:hypothetical protein
MGSDPTHELESLSVETHHERVSVLSNVEQVVWRCDEYAMSGDQRGMEQQGKLDAKALHV